VTSTLTPIQQTVAVVAAGALVSVVLWLIYRRRLREDYGALWLAVACLALVFAVWQDALRFLATLFDSITLTAPTFLLSILFLTVIAIHYSIRLSEHDRRIKRLAQEIALLEAGDPAPTRELERTDKRSGDVIEE
jgi:hypothetical protein